MRIFHLVGAFFVIMNAGAIATSGVNLVNKEQINSHVRFYQPIVETVKSNITAYQNYFHTNPTAASVLLASSALGAITVMVGATQGISLLIPIHYSFENPLPNDQFRINLPGMGISIGWHGHKCTLRSMLEDFQKTKKPGEKIIAKKKPLAGSKNKKTQQLQKNRRCSL